VQVYRMYHLQHHRYTWTKNDPDLGLAKPFPISKTSFRRKMLRDLSGQTGYQRYKLIFRLSAGLSANGKGLENKPLGTVMKNLWNRQKGFFITNAIILAGLTAAGHPEAFVLLWWLPAMTGYSVVLRVRNIAEHAAVPDPSDELKQTRTTLAPFYVRFFMAPHNVNYHLEHHLYMYVPHYHLRKMHKMLEKNGTLARAEVVKGYGEVLRKATTASETEYDGKERNRMSVFGGPVN
jgi:fatty acid desaturase